MTYSTCKPTKDASHYHGLCANCGLPCGGVWIDDGIGPYEYWGRRGWHSAWRVASDCCEDEIEEGEGCLVRTGYHVARKAMASGKIMPGDRYRYKVWKMWRSGGPSWWVTLREVIADGPARAPTGAQPSA